MSLIRSNEEQAACKVAISGRLFWPSRAAALTESMMASTEAHGLATTAVVAKSELLSGTGSMAEAVTLAVFVRSPGVVEETTIVIDALAPLLTVPKLHVTTPPDAVQLVEADLNVTPLGSVSVTTTPAAVSG